MYLVLYNGANYKNIYLKDLLKQEHLLQVAITHWYSVSLSHFVRLHT